MNLISSILLVLALWLAVLLGPQLSPWSWGAALLALGLAVLAAIPGNWRGTVKKPGPWLLGVGVVTVVWFAMRAWLSPVAEHGMMDLLLLGAVVGGFMVMRGMERSLTAERVFGWGLAVLLLVSVVVVIRQSLDPGFSPGLVGRTSNPCGLFGHYNYGANFLIGAACLVGGAAMFDDRFHRLERVVLGLVALAGIGVVYLTNSRGGQLGAAGALAVFVGLAMVAGVRRGSKWFAPAVIALPFVGIGLVAFLMYGWARSQEVRKVEIGMDKVLDNAIRLSMQGIAVSCVAEHPLEGGGSRSFAWECNRFWDNDSHGIYRNRPEQVHNEILQAASDYGLIGAGLLILWVGSVVVGGVVRAVLNERVAGASNEDAWRIGGLAGVAGLLVQSNFCFLFHVLPGALLLGICLGRAAHLGGTAGKEVPAGAAGRWVMVLCSAAGAVLLLPMGWKGTRVIAARWADRFSKPPQRSDEVVLGALTHAIAIWPLQEFYLDRAFIYQRRAVAGADAGRQREWAERAIADYTSAAALYPFDPMPVVNRATLLGATGRDAEARQGFDLAIRLQGGMEAAYQAVLSKTTYLLSRAEIALQEQRADEALDLLLEAREELLKKYEFPFGAPLWPEGKDLRVKIAERLGNLLSTAGRDDEAEAEYEDGANEEGGEKLRFYHAWHCYLAGTRVWGERKPQEALRFFLKGSWLIGRTGSMLPNGVTEADRLDLATKLDKNIQFLRDAKVEPAKAPGQ